MNGGIGRFLYRKKSLDIFYSFEKIELFCSLRTDSRKEVESHGKYSEIIKKLVMVADSDSGICGSIVFAAAAGLCSGDRGTVIPLCHI